MNESQSIESRLAERARVEIYIQSVRILKALTRDKKFNEATSFMEALRTGTTIDWEIDIEGLRGKRIFKKSVAIVRSLSGMMGIEDLLTTQQIDRLNEIIGCLADEIYKHDTQT
jgi:hypothetical protein